MENNKICKICGITFGKTSKDEAFQNRLYCDVCRVRRYSMKTEDFENWNTIHQEKIKIAVANHRERLAGVSNAGLREIIMKYKGNKCSVCGGTQTLVLHHKNYPNPALEDILLLCKICHHHMHKTQNMPK